LDFSIESVIGLLFACLNLGFLWHFAFPKFGPRGGAPESVPGLVPQLGFAALAAVYLSPNATVVLSWPLLTLNYTSHAFMLVFLWAAWRALSGGGRLSLSIAFAAALAMDVVTDDTGLVTTIAAILAAAVQAWRQRNWQRTVQVVAIVLAAYAVYALGYRLLIPAPEHVVTGGATQGLGLLLVQVPQAWKWAVIPLSSSVAHRSHSQAWVGAGADEVQILLAVAVALAHTWFWWRAFVGPRASLTSFTAIAMMLVFYGLLAGIILTRVGARGGSDYLWQPRYVMIYQWNLLALLLMGIDQVQASRGRVVRKATVQAGATILGIAAAGLLVLQIPFAVSAWGSLRFMSAYQQRMAFQIGAMAAQPDLVLGKCMPQIVICRYTPARRARLLQFMRLHRLNLFSPSFQARNRLYPDMGTLSALAPPGTHPPRPALRPDALPGRPTKAAVPAVH
jgi:hypothetical protein